MTSVYAPSINVAELRESVTIAVSARAKELKAAGRPVIDLGAGEPDTLTPKFIRDSACRAIQEQSAATRYTAVEGIPPLRQAIASHANEHYTGPDAITPAHVVVTTGSKQALFNSCFVLFGAGDEVLVPTPGWTSYYEMVSLAKATPVIVPGSRERSLKVTPADLIRHATPRTRGLVLNSPCNPTGAAYSRQELRALLDLASERDWWVISDEIYRHISYETPSPSVLDAAVSRERLVVVDGVAKAYAMTGWRIGWLIAPREVARSITALQSHTTSNAASISQYAALEALTNRSEAKRAVSSMVTEFRRRRDAAMDLWRKHGVDVIDPAGAFYFFVHVGDASAADPAPGSTFAKRILDECEVAVVPGAAFHAPEWIRLSYAAPMADVLEGVRRVIAALGSGNSVPGTGD